jgi:hypothetical protein
MRFLPCREILHFRATAFISDTARHFGSMKSDSSWVMRPSDQGYPAFIELLFIILAAWKCDSLSLLNHRFKVKWLTVSANSAFSWPKNAISGTSWNPRHRYMGFVEAFLVIRLPEDTIPQESSDSVPIAI